MRLVDIDRLVPDRLTRREKTIGLLPKEIEALEAEISGRDKFYPTPLTAYPNLKTIYGLTIVPVRFEDDPLFKELQAMAALVGADITYPDITYGQQNWKIDIAEFFRDGSGWRYVNGNGTVSGSSMLFPIDAPWPHGASVKWKEPLDE